MSDLPTDGSQNVCVEESIPFTLTRRDDAPPLGDELTALVAFRAAAARIKAAEAEMRAASQAYGEAIKRLSEASTK